MPLSFAPKQMGLVQRLLSNAQNQTWAHQAYSRLKLELAALAAAELRPVIVHPGQAAQQVLSLVPRLRALTGELTKALPMYDQRRFDKLERIRGCLG